MLIYEKPIKNKLLFFRILSIPLIGLTVEAYNNGNLNFFYFLIVVFIFLNFVSIQNFIVRNDCIEIKKYFLFVWITAAWTFDCNELFYIFPEISDIGMQADFEQFDADTETGCLLSLFYVFQPNKITKQEFTLQTVYENGKYKKIVRVKLDRYELNLLKRFKEQCL